jgi:hypothetical protein
MVEIFFVVIVIRLDKTIFIIIIVFVIIVVIVFVIIIIAIIVIIVIIIIIIITIITIIIVVALYFFQKVRFVWWDFVKCLLRLNLAFQIYKIYHSY